MNFWGGEWVVGVELVRGIKCLGLRSSLGVDLFTLGQWPAFESRSGALASSPAELLACVRV